MELKASPRPAVSNSVGSAPGATTFHGLFCGINRYESAAIANLKSARRDAQALHALFTDNLGGNALLLTDEEATTARVRAELAALQNTCAEDDVVVIAFSGHGTDTHELVTYDTDPWDLPNTALPLGELTELISAVPAKHLLVILDCCFSGGAGAKVLHAENVSRGTASGVPMSTDALLSQMGGTGRVILTASTADQEAWENPRLGHGYLTYYILQALLGAADPASAATFHFIDLLKYIVEQVKSHVSSGAGALQEPTLRGQFDGDVVWPRFTPGALYNALYPPLAAAPVNKDIRSLAHHGLPDQLLDAWSSTLPTLNQLQQEAINEASLLNGQNVLVMAPTSSGKTMIGELAALHATQTGGRSVFLLPTKALVNEQYERFAGTYGPLGVRVLRASGDVSDDVGPLLRGQFDLAIFTYEKFSGLVLAYPHLLRMISVVVVDEVQTVVDPGRGRELELLLTLVKTRSDEDIRPQVIALSAVLGELNGLDSWFDAYLLKRTERPVKLDEGVLNLAGQYRFVDADGNEQSEQLIPQVWGDGRAQTLLIPLLRKLVAEGQQVIVIRGERGPARGSAEYLAASLGLPPATDALAQLPTGDPTASTIQLRTCLEHGIAFHVSDLGPEERRIIEQEFRKTGSQIRVVVATTTLAQGINMPAETVVMPELSRRTAQGPQWYRVAEYKNIVGRAGRLGLVERGRAITFALDWSDEQVIWDRFVNGTPEDIHSVLLGSNVDLYTVVLRVAAIAADRSTDGSAATDDLIGILANSLAAHQTRLSGGGDPFELTTVAAAIQELQRAGFLESVESGRTKLTSLGRLVSVSALTVRSAVRIVDALRGVPDQYISAAALLGAAQVTEELDAVRLTVNARGVKTELATFGGEVQRRVPAAVASALNNAPSAVAVAARCKKLVTCMLWIQGVPLGQIERSVMQHYKDRNASGPIGQVVARTQDVISTVIDIAAELHPGAMVTFGQLAQCLPVQLQLGIPEGVVDLAQAGANLRREDYLRLAQAGIVTAQQINEESDDRLRDLLDRGDARLSSLRRAAEQLAQQAEATPALGDLLGRLTGKA